MRTRILPQQLTLAGIVTAAALLSGAVGLHAAGQSADTRSTAAPATAPRQFLDRYCVGCHNEKRKANFADLALDTADVQTLATKADTWEKVIKKLSVRAMPPVNMPRPSAA